MGDEMGCWKGVKWTWQSIFAGVEKSWVLIELRAEYDVDYGNRENIHFSLL